MSQLAFFSTIEKLCAQESNMRKKASDGGEGLVDDSSVPDDPNGNGTVDYSTGDFDESVDSEVHEGSDSNADDADVVTDADVTAGMDNIGTDVAEVDDHVVDEYNLEVPDYGTSTPMKTSSYKYASLSLSQLQGVFRKKASLILGDIRERNARTKQASASRQDYQQQPQQSQQGYNLLYDNMRKLAAIQQEAIHDAALTAANMAYVTKKAASGEDITDEDIPVDITGESPATLTDTLEDATPISDVPPEVIEELVTAPEAQLQLIEEAAQAVDEGQITPEQAIELIQGAEAADDVDEEVDTSSLDEALGDEEDMEKESSYNRIRKYAEYIRARKIAALQRILMHKVAEEVPITEADVAAASELPADDLAAIDALPPEALDEIIALEDMVEAGEIPPEIAVAAIEGNPEVEAAIEEATSEPDVAVEDVEAAPDVPVTDDEAAAEFSSVLADEGVTPNDLEAIAAADESSEKQASALRAIARSVSQYRTKKAAYHVTKSARQAAIRQRCRKVLTELMTGN